MHKKRILVLFLVLSLALISQSALSAQSADSVKRMKKRVAVFHLKTKPINVFDGGLGSR